MSLGEMMTLIGTLPKNDPDGNDFIFGNAHHFAVFQTHGMRGCSYQTFHARTIFVFCFPLARTSGGFTVADAVRNEGTKKSGHCPHFPPPAKKHPPLGRRAHGAKGDSAI